MRIKFLSFSLFLSFSIFLSFSALFLLALSSFLISKEVQVLSPSLILLWATPHFHFLKWKKAHLTNSSLDCGNGKRIFVTNNPKFLTKSRVVLFLLQELQLEQKWSSFEEWKSIYIPKNKIPSQIWALFWRQTPSELGIPNERLLWLNAIFDLTVSYRRDSDIWYPFGTFSSIPHKDRLNTPWNTINMKSGIFVENNYRNCYFKLEHNRLLATRLQREDTINFTTQYVDHCEKSRETEKQNQNFKDSSRYFVALNPEICEDYIEESYFKALNSNLVPLVLGGQDFGYDEVGLPGTYIDMMDFETSRELFESLKDLSNYPLEAIQYLTWQFDFKIHFPFPPKLWICPLVSWKKNIISPIFNFTQWWTQKKCFSTQTFLKTHLL